MARRIDGPVVLIVLDGWGLEEAHEHNGVALAKTPTYDALSQAYPFTTLHTSGEHVGLPDGQMGNSEVGHTTIGAGTVVCQDLVRIGKAARDNDFEHNPAMQEAFNHTRANSSQLHIIGLLSSGGVHAHEDHFFEVMRAAKKARVNRIVLHPILDGRDTSPTGGNISLAKLEALCRELKNCVIASVAGRYFPMDRDKNWDRTDKGFQAIWNGKAEQVYSNNISPASVVKQFYDKGQYDETMEPIVFASPQGKPYTVKSHDSLIFTNFRTDRTRQLSHKISQFIQSHDLCFVTMTDYGSEIASMVAYEPQTIEHTIASVVSGAGLKQVHLAETDKYAHATYFLNGGRYEPYDNEEHVLIPSRKDVKTHDEAPEMKAKEIADAAIERLGANDFIFINFANADMVGHTAKREAIVKAVETVDRELKRVVDVTVKHNGVALVIADHGNAERMVDPATGQPHTAHTTNVVPCILVSSSLKDVLLKDNKGLKDIAPTILDLLGLDTPFSMTGESLIKSV